LQARLLAWFAENGRPFYWRNRRASQYEIIISEILLQRTRAETVAAFLPAFLEHAPSWQSLVDMPEPELHDLLRPLGLWRRRANSLRGLARILVNYGGELPTTRQEIQQLPAVGQYIANAIALFALRERAALLDVNMARVLERFFGPRTRADIRYDPWLQDLSLAVVNCEDCDRVNWAILDLAAMVCTSRSPRCSECPVARGCRYFTEARKE
jgi:A/G-specific adenine glycosylase